jgi:hypothetical protein
MKNKNVIIATVLMSVSLAFTPIKTKLTSKITANTQTTSLAVNDKKLIESINELVLDGKKFSFEKNEITLDKDKKKVWNLTGITKNGQETITFNIRTSENYLASGTYPLTQNGKKIPEGKVAFSITIMNTASSLGMLGMKIYASIEEGSATVVNENGKYSISLNGVSAVGLDKKTKTVTANLSKDK